MMASAVRKILSETGTREPEQREHAERKGDVGGGRDRPAAQGPGACQVQGDIDEGGHHHAAERRHARQNPARPGGELPVQHLALDLQAHQQEEHGHERVIDPVQDAEARHIGFEHAEVGRGQAASSPSRGQRPPPPSGRGRRRPRLAGGPEGRSRPTARDRFHRPSASVIRADGRPFRLGRGGPRGASRRSGDQTAGGQSRHPLANRLTSLGRPGPGGDR